MRVMDRAYGAGGRHDYDQASGLRWATRTLREEFAALSEHQQAEKLEQVRQTLRAERARRQRSPSARAARSRPATSRRSRRSSTASASTRCSCATDADVCRGT